MMFCHYCTAPVLYIPRAHRTEAHGPLCPVCYGDYAAGRPLGTTLAERNEERQRQVNIRLGKAGADAQALVRLRRRAVYDLETKELVNR